MGTINCLLNKNAKSLPDHPAVIGADKTISYADLNHTVWVVTKNLQNLGVAPGNRVAIISPNNIDYIITLLALWRLGAVACPLSTRLPEEAIRDYVQRINASLLITSTNLIFESDRIAVAKLHINEIMQRNPFEIQESEVRSLIFSYDQPATILFTSGSMGEPKATLHTFGNHLFSAKGASENIPVKPDDHWLLTLPLYHIGGLSILFRVLLGQGTLIILYPGDPIDQTIEKYNITHISLVATQLHRLLHSEAPVPALKKLKAIVLGGSHIPAQLVRKSFELGLPVFFSYGLTEMSSQVATSPMPLAKPRVLSFREIKIAHDKEILVKGECLFHGYVEGLGLELPVDHEGWFATGDLGFLTGDGELNVTGRKDNLFISGGENIQPEEIERHLSQLEDIEQAIIVPIHHEEFGYRPVAFIKENSSKRLNHSLLYNHLLAHLPKFKIPEKFYRWPSSLADTEMKVSRDRLRQLVQNNHQDLQSIE
ncbi:MAG: o-succinylbenzoate--CoA ligase [Candidatus Omnitrophota bacterium]|nr:o-succinylbenzoate--CoA ligase [Candidatus Omnitrophota bacterium]